MPLWSTNCPTGKRRHDLKARYDELQLNSMGAPLPIVLTHLAKGFRSDVTGMGRCGNLDVQVALISLEELTYIMGLVRQSFERQMGNGDEQ
jgi:predicted transport protein